MAVVDDQRALLVTARAPLAPLARLRDAATACRFRAGLHACACDSVPPAPVVPAPPVPAAAGIRPDHRFAAAIREAFIGPGLD